MGQKLVKHITEETQPKLSLKFLWKNSRTENNVTRFEYVGIHEILKRKSKFARSYQQKIELIENSQV